MIPVERARDFVRTRAVVPAVPKDAIARRQLRPKFDRISDHRITTILAPAGYGKTTAVAAWVQEAQVPTAWLSLNGEESDVRRFWRCVAYSLSEVLPSETSLELASQLDALPVTESNRGADALLNELNYHGAPIYLVLDDYQEIDDQLVHDSLTRFVEYLPANVHLIVLRRTTPPFPLARWAAKGWKYAIDRRDLAFSESETGELFQRCFQITLSPSETRDLSRLTEGWVVGLKLLGLSWRPFELASQLRAGAHGPYQAIADYLMEEVWNSLPLDVQETLLRLSIAKRLDRELAHLLAETEEGWSILARAERQGLFVSASDPERTGYRFHEVFSQFVQAKLRQRDREPWVRLHRRAAQYLAGRHRVGEAMEHLRDAGAYPELASLIDQRAADLINHGEIFILLHWVDQLPESERQLAPRTWALVAFAMATAGEQVRAESILDDLEHRYGDAEPLSDRGAVYGHVCRVKAFLLAGRGEFSRSLPYIERFFRYTPAAELQIWRTLRHHRGELFLARTDFGLKGKTGVSFPEAKAFLDRLLTFGSSIVDNPLFSAYLPGYIYLALAEYLYETDQLPEAEIYLHQAQTIAHHYPDLSLQVPIYTNAARMLSARDMGLEAFQKIDECIQLVAAKGESHWIQPLTAYQVQLLLQSGRVEEALNHSRRLRVLPNDVVRSDHYYQYVALARVLMRLQDFPPATRILADLRALAVSEEQPYSYLEATLLLAASAWDQGAEELAYQHFQEALAVGQRYGLIRIFVDEPDLQGLAEGYASWREHHGGKSGSESTAYVDAVLWRMWRASHQLATPAREGLDAALSDREWEVAFAIARGWSNKEIAQRLNVSYRTVTTHIENIFRKMDVHSRTELIARLRKMERPSLHPQDPTQNT